MCDYIQAAIKKRKKYTETGSNSLLVTNYFFDNFTGNVSYFFFGNFNGNEFYSYL